MKKILTNIGILLMFLLFGGIAMIVIACEWKDKVLHLLTRAQRRTSYESARIL